MDDRELVKRCLLGESAAWRELVERHVVVMRALAVRALPASPNRDTEAEEVLQAVFLKLWADGRRRLAAFRGSCRLSTWLGAVTRREALDRLRKDQRRARHLRAARQQAEQRFVHEVEQAGDPAGVGRLEADARRERLVAAAGGLPPRDRLLLRLVYEDGCSYREAARLLQARENSIGPWLTRAQERLRALLEPAPSAERTDRTATDL